MDEENDLTLTATGNWCTLFLKFHGFSMTSDKLNNIYRWAAFSKRCSLYEILTSPNAVYQWWKNYTDGLNSSVLWGC